MGEPVFAATALTAARFIGPVTISREGDALTVTGSRAPALPFHLRETVGGVMLIGGLTAAIVGTLTDLWPVAAIGVALAVLSLAVYGLGYLLLRVLAGDGAVTFEQSSIQGVEVYPEMPRWLTPGWRKSGPRVSFNVVDARFRPTPYEFLLETNDALVALAALIAREGASGGGTLTLR